MVFATHMNVALEEAEAAGARGEVPVGAALALDGVVVARAGNRCRELNDPTAHAEVLVIREACSKLGQERLEGAELYVTLEPCPMCAAAISAARVARLYYGASDAKSGGIEQGPKVFEHAQCHHVPEVYTGIGKRASVALLDAFFAAKRG